MLPIVLLGLRTAYKEDIKASPSELLLGTCIRIPGSFFVPDNQPIATTSFLDNLRSHFQAVQPRPTSHHIKPKVFRHEDLGTCSHVFKLVAAVKPPLTPPYTGPHRVLRRLDDHRYIIDVDGRPASVSTSLLVSGYVADDNPGPQSQHTVKPKRTVHFELPEPEAQDPPPAPENPVPGLPSDQPTSRGGVAVAPLPSSATLPSRRQRKQVLVPRPEF
ncbi:uncharacterized protein LOC126742458 [Anthonomus grandis grandis]|uniref:uncharacterized protein LOC126742458 n=1 Tax=Anthonomus grandis grandis TaxID=2921223 RepID=UPI002165F5BA|nr:uncharacterized protein LOC126742458 [Anthonomus grandis grandis]